MKNICRFFVLFLCCALLVSTVVRPVQVNADTATISQIATSYGDVVNVAPYLLPFIAILVGLEWYYSNIDEIVIKSEELYNSASTILLNWATRARDQILNGAEKIKLSIKERLELNALLASLGLTDVIPLGTQSITLPNWRTIDLYGSDVFTSSSIEILTQVNVGISQLVEAYEAFPDVLSTAITDVTSSITDQKTELQEWLGNVNANTAQYIIDVKEWVGHLNSTTSTWGRNTVDWLKNVNSNIVTGVSTGISDLTGVITGWKSEFDKKIDVVFPPFSSLLPSLGSAGNGLQEDTQEGKDKILYYSGVGKDLLSKYNTAFLAVGVVLTKFLNIPVVGDLVEFSLALGIFALFINLANTMLSNDNSSKTKGKANSAKKGG